MINLKSPRAILMITLTAALVCAWFIAPDYGVSWDEVGIYRYASRMLGAYQFILHPLDFDSFDPDPLLNLYGPAHFIYVALASRFLLLIQPLWTPDTAAHFVYFTTYLVGIFLLYLLFTRWMSEWAALGAVLLSLTQPLFWGHAFTNPKDTPFMMLFIASIYSGFWMMDNSETSKIKGLLKGLTAGIVLGITTSTRTLGPLAGAIVILYGLKNAPRRAIFLAPFYLLLAALITWLTWPYLWKAPLVHFMDSLLAMSKFPNTGYTLFMGELYPADQLPPLYFPTFISLQLTETILLLIIIGAVFAVRLFLREKKRDPILLFVVWFFIPALYIGLSGSTLYDNARQLLFLLPPLLMFAGIALDGLMQFIKPAPLRIMFLLIMLLPGVHALIQYHPYQYVYFNSFIGGAGGAFRKLDLDYSGTSFKEAQEFLNSTAEQGAQIVVIGPRQNVRWYARPDLKDRFIGTQDEIDLRGAASYYVIFLTRTNADTYRCQQSGETLYTIERDGGVLAYIKRISSEEKCW